MKKLFILWLGLWLLFSCGGKKEEAEETGKAAVQRDEPVQAIPEAGLSEFERLANGYIRPYFDAEGTQMEKTVKAGDPFELYVLAEYSPDFAMCAAEYRLVLPEGVTITSSANCDSTILTLGRHEEDFSTTFHCTAGPKMWLVRYVCATDPSTKGGEIRTEQGNKMNFLGFSMCDGDFTLVNARPGKATLTVE
jgi:hypothetical protein